MSSANKGSTTGKTVKHTLSLKDSKKRQLLYLINYTNGGFAVVAGDKRANPILAYSKHNALPVSMNERLPGGLKLWLQRNMDFIKNFKESNTKNALIRSSANITKNNSPKNSTILWNRLLGLKNTAVKNDSLTKVPTTIPIDPNPCKSWHKQVESLLTTVWGQGYGYNDFTPQLNCSTTINGHAWTGCVATAMAQVMNYYKFPGQFNWDNMPDAVYTPNVSVSQLMAAIGGAVNMNYGCNASGAKTSTIVPALHGYLYHADMDDYDQGIYNQEVIDELDAGRVVLFQGMPKHGDGHVWVADGYYQGHSCPGQTNLYFDMNWGWNGSYDGLYYFNYFDPGGTPDYNHDVHIIVNIKPKWYEN